MVRVKSQIWVQAYLKRCSHNGIPAFIVHKGDLDAGAIYIKINCLDGQVRLFGPAPFFASETDGDRKWCLCLGSDLVDEDVADNYLSRQRDMDCDLWIVELEDRLGRHLLDSSIVEL